MTQRTKGTISKKNASQIIGIQFSILSPEEIRKGSVAEITSRDTYINNKPVINGMLGKVPLRKLLVVIHI